MFLLCSGVPVREGTVGCCERKNSAKTLGFVELTLVVTSIICILSLSGVNAFHGVPYPFAITCIVITSLLVISDLASSILYAVNYKKDASQAQQRTAEQITANYTLRSTPQRCYIVHQKGELAVARHEEAGQVLKKDEFCFVGSNNAQPLEKLTVIFGSSDQGRGTTLTAINCLSLFEQGKLHYVFWGDKSRITVGPDGAWKKTYSS